MLIISSHVLGGVGTRSLRYQSSSVLELIGIAHSALPTVAVWTGPARSWLRIWDACDAGTGRIHFAVANSAVQSTSIARMSIEESFAASLRTSDTRCPSEDVERKLILMLYLPPDCWLHCVAAAWNEPEGSGNTYQLIVTGPFFADPQAANRTVTKKVARIAGVRPLDLARAIADARVRPLPLRPVPSCLRTVSLLRRLSPDAALLPICSGR